MPRLTTKHYLEIHHMLNYHWSNDPAPYRHLSAQDWMDYSNQGTEARRSMCPRLHLCLLPNNREQCDYAVQLSYANVVPDIFRQSRRSSEKFPRLVQVNA